MNPYSPSDPVTNLKMFYGYRQELDYIVRKVAAPQKQRSSFFVLGGRMMGKTSLLRQVQQRLQRLNIELPFENRLRVTIPLYLNVLDISPTPNAFLEELTRLLSHHLARTPPPFDIPTHATSLLQSVKTHPDPSSLLHDALRELAQSAHPIDLGLVFLIDDLFRMKRRQTVDLIRSQLRAFITSYTLDGIIAVIISGSYHEFGASHSVGSPLENILMLQELHVFDEEQALALINEPTGGHIPMQVAQEVFLETGGHPFLIQYVMSVLCDQEDWTQLTVEDVSQATERFLKERRDFERWVEKLSEADRKIYAAFCQLEQVSSVDDLARMMLSILAEGGRSLIVNRLMILDSLRVLSAMGLIRECSDGLYELAGKWPARWFRQKIYRPGGLL